MTALGRSFPGTGSDADRPQPSEDAGTDGGDRLSARRGVVGADQLRGLPPTLDVETAARILGCGRTLAYELIRRGEFPCRVLHLGKRYLIPTAELLDVVGLPTGGDPPDSGSCGAHDRGQLPAARGQNWTPRAPVTATR